MHDLSELSPDPFFDEYGDYRHLVAVSEVLFENQTIDNSIFYDSSDVFKAYE